MKKIIIGAIALIVIIGVGFLTFDKFVSESSSDKVETKIVITHGLPMADFSDKKNLSGAVDFVFSGEVVSKVGQIDAHYPTSQYKVKVTKELKGKLPSDEILLNQYGGYLTEEEDGKEVEFLHLFDNDPLLEVSKEYYFAANLQENGSILLIPLYGNTIISSKEQKGALQNEFVEAIKNQKVPEIQKRINEAKSK